MKTKLKYLISRSKIFSIIYNIRIINSYLNKYKIIFIAENKSWSILDDGLNLQARLNKIDKNFMCVLKKPGFFHNEVLHLISIFVD